MHWIWAGRRERVYPDEHRIDQWVKNVLDRTPGGRTFETLVAMTTAIREQFKYVVREQEGVQSPLETLELRRGSCRDFAVFMMEAARGLGLGARFVSGYLYDEHLVGAASGMVGTGATHAWLQVYLPGAGWVEFDPDQCPRRRPQSHSRSGGTRCGAGRAGGGQLQGPCGVFPVAVSERDCHY